MPLRFFPVLFAATAVCGLLFLSSPSNAVAAVDDEVALAGSIVRDAVLELDTLKDSEKRAEILQNAVEAIAVLEALAGPSIENELAKQTLAELVGQAVTPDVLRLSLVEALSAGITAGEAGLERDLSAKAAMEDIKDPAYRSAAWSEIARAHMRVNQPAEAERLAMRAIEEAKAIKRIQTRDGAMRAAVLVLPFDGTHTGIIEAATNAMATASARSQIYRMEALAGLSRGSKLSSDQLVEISRKSLDKEKFAEALQAARALERDDERRKDLLDQLFDKAINNSDETFGLQILKSMARDRDQDRALRKLVDLRLKRDKPIRAKELMPLMLTDNARVDGEIAIAKALDQQGYEQAALDTLKSVDVSPTDDPDGAADLVSALAGLSAYDLAQSVAGSITDPAKRSFAFSRLSKRLSDDERIEEARRALAEVTQPDDRSFALSGLARALVKSDKLDEAKSILKELPDGPDRDRVLEALAKRRAASHPLGDAQVYLSEMATGVASSRILIATALSLPESKRADARSMLERAKSHLPVGQDAAHEMADVAVAYAELGELATADAILDGMVDKVVKLKAERRIADKLLLEGKVEAVNARFPRLSQPGQAAVLAAMASERFRKDWDVEAFVTAVRDLPFQVRVPALRAMSEARARRLDTQNWLTDPGADPLSSMPQEAVPQEANFLFGRHVVQAPAPSTRTFTRVAMPDIFSLNADVMRARVPAPAGGVAHLAILGFSPFSLEAFKLTSGGTAAIHQVQVSQQLTWPRYIAVEKGIVTLGNLLRDLPEIKANNLLVDKGDVLLVRVPIIVLPGATLLMSGAEFAQYQLGALSGAFIAVAGKLVVQDAEIVGYDEHANAPVVADEQTKSIFRPFITGWGGSDLQIAGSRFAMLGYDSSKAFGLTQSSGAAVQSLYSIDENRPTGNIVDNSFENLRYGYYSYEAEGVRLIGNEYRDNVVYGIDPHDRSQHLLIALNTTYGSQKKHGIIVSREVTDSFIVGNVSLWNKGSGLMLDRTSSRNIVYVNTAQANSGDGLTFYESGCNIAASNEFNGNHRAGIKVRNSTNVGMFDNRIKDNKTSGADIYISDLRASPEGRSRNFELDPYEPISTTVISGNLFTANGTAINVAGASQTIIEANKFRNQRSSIYGGDLRALSPYLLQLGQTSATLIATACQPQQEIEACPFNGWHLEQDTEAVCIGPSQPLRTGISNGAQQNNG